MAATGIFVEISGLTLPRGNRRSRIFSDKELSGDPEATSPSRTEYAAVDHRWIARKTNVSVCANPLTHASCYR
jgi:hypothetical protein